MSDDPASARSPDRPDTSAADNTADTGDVSTTSEPDDAYRGVPGAFPYAFRASESWLFRGYVVAAAVVTGLLTVLFALTVVRVFGSTGAGFSVGRAFVVVVGLGAVAPVVAPVLLVARTHRRGIERRTGYEAGLAVAGFLFVVSLYGLALAAMPETFVIDGERVTRPPAAEAGVFAPLVAVLYAIPSAYSLAVPTGAAALIAAVHYLRR